MPKKQKSLLLTGDQLVLAPTMYGEETRRLGGGIYHGNTGNDTHAQKRLNSV